jgi:hypothetical protein
VRDKGDDAHLPTAQRAQKREQLVDAGNQHRPQVVGWALGRRRLWGRSNCVDIGADTALLRGADVACLMSLA